MALSPHVCSRVCRRWSTLLFRVWCCRAGPGHGSRPSWPPDTAGLCFQVFGDKDADGFYRGEGGGRMGYIPCNMVAEVAADSPAGRQQLLQRGSLSPDVLVEGSGMVLLSFPHVPPPQVSPLLRLYVWSMERLCVWRGGSRAPGPHSLPPRVGSATAGWALYFASWGLGMGEECPLETCGQGPWCGPKRRLQSHCPIPCLSFFLTSACLPGSGNGTFLCSAARTAGPPPKPRRSKKGG